LYLGDPLLVTGFPAEAFGTNCYVVAAAPGEQCLIVDPGIGVLDALDEVLAEHRLQPAAVLLTHGHLDHTFSVAPVCGARGIPAYVHPADLEMLADWLQACGVTTVAMESTGVYWIALFELLERRGFAVCLVDPRQTRHAPGRPKSDVLDCQWIQRLHCYGLLAASFRPADQVVVLRSYLRQRQMLGRC